MTTQTCYHKAMEYLQQALIELAKKYRSLEQENRQLRKQLESHDISLPVPMPSAPDTDPDQGARIQFPWITEYMVRFFFSMFWGRMDVYAKRGKNGGWYPQCLYRWNAGVCPKHTNPKSPCSKCLHRGWEAINPKILLRSKMPVLSQVSESLLYSGRLRKNCCNSNVWMPVACFG